MSRPRLAQDTPLEIEDQQIASWRAMTLSDKGKLIGQLTASALAMTEAGIRARYPAATDREVFLRLACIRLGRALATRVYPDAAGLHD